MKILDDRKLKLVGRMSIEHLAKVEELEGQLETSERALKRAETLLASLADVLVLTAKLPVSARGKSLGGAVFMEDGTVRVSFGDVVGSEHFKLEFVLKKP